MPWTWRYEKTDGTAVPADDLQEAIFASQGDAESWLGENWRALVKVGVEQVTLLDDTRVEYGPMALHAEDLSHNYRWCLASILGDLRAVRDPVSVGDLADHEAAAA